MKILISRRSCVINRESFPLVILWDRICEVAGQSQKWITKYVVTCFGVYWKLDNASNFENNLSIMFWITSWSGLLSSSFTSWKQTVQRVGYCRQGIYSIIQNHKTNVRTANIGSYLLMVSHLLTSIKQAISMLRLKLITLSLLSLLVQWWTFKLWASLPFTIMYCLLQSNCFGNINILNWSTMY